MAVVRGGDAGGHGFWVHSSRTYGIWSEGVAGEDVSVPFRLELGRVDGRAVKIRIPGEVNAGAGNEMVFDAAHSGLLRSSWNGRQAVTEAESRLPLCRHFQRSTWLRCR